MNASANLEKEKFKKYLFKLQRQSNKWVEELDFIEDEQLFLEHLLSAHFLDLSSKELYEPAKKLIQKLKDVEKMNNELSIEIQTHHKHLATLVESLQVNARNEIRKEQKRIKKDFAAFELKFRYVKKKIFKMIKDIMKDNKQKLLLKNQ
ncbi:MAG: hypothetical protein ABFR05_01905 [Bacteroidota bacterium]